MDRVSKPKVLWRLIGTRRCQDGATYPKAIFSPDLSCCMHAAPFGQPDRMGLQADDITAPLKYVRVLQLLRRKSLCKTRNKAPEQNKTL